MPEAKTESFAAGERADIFIGSHAGYERLDPPVVHRRTIVQFKDGVCFVRDQALGTGRRVLRVFWRPAAGFRLERFSDCEVCLVDGDRRLVIASPRSTEWRREIFDGEHSAAYGAKTSAPVVELIAEGDLPTQAGVFLLGRGIDDDAEAVVTPLHAPGEASRFDLRCGGETTAVWLADSNNWILSGWKTDAAVLCWRQGPRGRTLIALGAKKLEWRGQLFFSSEKAVELFECWSEDGVFKSRSSGAVAPRTKATLKMLEAVKPLQ